LEDDTGLVRLEQPLDAGDRLHLHDGFVTAPATTLEP
jgi:hypothetical protein